MEPIQMDTQTAPPVASAAQCTDCQKAAGEEVKNEEMSIAFLLALVPVISLTFFGQIGLL